MERLRERVRQVENEQNEEEDKKEQEGEKEESTEEEEEMKAMLEVEVEKEEEKDKKLLFGLIRPSLLQNISADLISVSPGANITLLCNITNYSEKSWYQMISAGLRQIISARQSSLNKHFYVDYNVDESHFYLTESSSSVSLVIIGVRETDLGFYYCGGRNDEKHIQFGKLIRLNFT
ncbi:hypothetical protein C0J50_22089, partial [Silurus asotus]